MRRRAPRPPRPNIAGGPPTLDATPSAGDDNKAVTYNHTTGAFDLTTMGGFTSPLTTKGDIHTYTTVDARLAVGADGYLLEADSTASTGNAWRKSQTGRAASTVPRSTADSSLFGWAHPHSTREVWGLHQATASGFDTFSVGTTVSGVTTQSAQSDSDGPFRGLATSAASGNGWNVAVLFGAGVYAKTGTRASFVFRTDPTLFTTDTRLWVGLATQTPGDATSVTGGSAVMLRAHSEDGDTQWTPVTRDGTTTTDGTPFGPTLADSTVYRIDFVFTSATSCTITVTNLDAGTTASSTVTATLPAAATALTFRVQMFTKSNNVRRLDYGSLIQSMIYGSGTYLG